MIHHGQVFFTFGKDERIRRVVTSIDIRQDLIALGKYHVF